MGRKSKAKRAGKGNSSVTRVTDKCVERPKFSTSDLLTKAEEYVDTFQFELAQQFCTKALQQEPDCLRALELSGVLCLETADFEQAKNYFNKAITLQPEEGHSKYMYMGQIHTGAKAVAYFNKGIELMKKHISEISSQETASAEDSEGSVSAQDISSAYCSIAEIYLTDECFDENAEARCEECLRNAVTECESNAEARHLFASFWLSKDDKEKALAEMQAGLALWLPQWREACVHDRTSDSQPLSLCSLSYPARINAAKILIELQQYDTAGEILELLLDEEDEVAETWYLLGWVNYLQGEDYKNNARFYLGKAQKIAVKTGCDDQQLTAHTQELLDELGGPVGENDGDGVNEDIDVDTASDSDDDDVTASQQAVTATDKTNGYEQMDQ